MIQVMLVAPVRAYREALVGLISADEELAVVAHAASAAEALASAGGRTPSVSLLDFGMEHFLPALAALRHSVPAASVLALGVPTGGLGAETVVRAAETGVTGFIDAEQPLAEVVVAIHQSARGEAPCSPRIAATLLNALRRRTGPPAAARLIGEWELSRADLDSTHLTPRELMVAQLVAHGMSNRQIARELVVGEATVKSHVHAVLRKLGVRSRDQITLADILDAAGTRPVRSRMAVGS